MMGFVFALTFVVGMIGAVGLCALIDETGSKGVAALLLVYIGLFCWVLTEISVRAFP